MLKYLRHLQNPLVVLALGLPLVLGILAACDDDDDDRKKGQATQQQVMRQAINAVPPYIPTKYTAREDINWSLQETEGRHIWYVYALSMNGDPLFYVISDVLPRAKCVSITPPDRVVNRSRDPDLVMSSPALDGTYYGGGGNCDVYYLRDAQTGGYIQMTSRSMTVIASKVPLSIETDRLRLEPESVHTQQAPIEPQSRTSIDD